MKEREICRYRTAAYIRLSREDGDREESDSVINQKKLLSGFIASREDLELRDFYIDDGFTGTSFERPAFQRMMDDIRRGEVNCVAVKDLSRFGRDYIDTGRYLERLFPELGVRFISVTDQIDSSRKSYDMLLPIKNIFNEQYARDISEKIQATMREKQRAGEFIGAFASYGYQKSPRDKNRLVPDPYAAGVVRRIFDMFLGGMGKQSIARKLNEEGVLCPAEYKAASGQHYRNGNCPEGRGFWTYSTVNSILHKEIYAGNMVQGTKHQKMRGRQKRVDREDWIVVPGTHEPIIDKETWKKTRRLLEKRTRETGIRTDMNVFSGFLKCGDCGRSMVRTGWRRGDGSRSYSFYCGTYKRNGKMYCAPHTVPARVMEQIVRNDLKILLQNTEISGQICRERERSGEREMPDPERFRTEIRKMRRLEQAVYEDYREGLLSLEEFEMYREDYRRKEELCRKQMDAIQTRKGENRGRRERRIRAALALLRERGPEKLNREMLEELIERIIVYENRRIHIIYRFSGEAGEKFPAVWRESSL